MVRMNVNPVDLVYTPMAQDRHTVPHALLDHLLSTMHLETSSLTVFVYLDIGKIYLMDAHYVPKIRTS